MTLSSLMAIVRQRIDDRQEPYRIDNETLVDFINEAEQEACRRAHLLIDKDTDSTCRILVVPGKSIYRLSPKVLKIRACYIGPYIRANTLSWSASTKSLVDSGNGFLNAGFAERNIITVMGFSKSGNNGIFTIANVTAGNIVVNETGISDETLGESVMAVVEGEQRELPKKTPFELNDWYSGWRNYEGEPFAFTQEEDGEIRLVGIPSVANTLRLVVSRLPLNDMAYADRETVSPEIPEQYHKDMLDWVYHQIYSTDDADEVDFQKAKIYEDRMASKFGSRPSARVEQFKKLYPRELQVRPVNFG